MQFRELVFFLGGDTRTKDSYLSRKIYLKYNSINPNNYPLVICLQSHQHLEIVSLKHRSHHINFLLGHLRWCYLRNKVQVPKHGIQSPS